MTNAKLEANIETMLVPMMEVVMMEEDTTEG